MRFMYPTKPNRITVDSPLFTNASIDPNFVLQIKKNGWRCLIHKLGDTVEFYSRHKKRMEPIVMDANWEAFADEVRKLEVESCIADGELMHRRGNIKNKIYLWDLFYVDGQIFRKPYGERKARLDSITPELNHLAVVEDHVDNFLQIWENLSDPKENEGLVIKDLREPVPVLYSEPSKKSARQFKILLDDQRNYVGA